MRGEIDELVDEVCSRVVVFGPRSEIARLTETLIVEVEEGEKILELEHIISTSALVYDVGHEDEGIPISDHDRRYARMHYWGTDRQPRYLVIGDDAGAMVLDFSAYCDFPLIAFQEIGRRFPSLSFDCSVIEFNGEWKGCGWINPPPGGAEFVITEAEDENFDDDVFAPKTAMERLRYEALVAPLRMSAQTVDDMRAKAVDDMLSRIRRVVVEPSGATRTSLPNNMADMVVRVVMEDRDAFRYLVGWVEGATPLAHDHPDLKMAIAELRDLSGNAFGDRP